MPCKAKELIDILKVKEQSARSNRSVYTAAINQLTAMVKDDQAKQNDATEKKAENTVTVPDVDIDIDKLMEELAQPFSGNSESLYKTIPVNTEVLEEFAGILDALPTDSLRQALTLTAFTLGAPKEGIDKIRKILTQGYKQVLEKEYITRTVNSALNIIYSAQMTKDDSALKDILEYKDAADKGSYNSKYILQRLKKAFSESSAVEDDDNYVADGPIQFSVDKSAPGRLDGGFALLTEEDVRAVSPEVSHLVDAGKIKLADSSTIQEMISAAPDSYNYSIVGESSRLARKMGLDIAQKMLSEGKPLDEVKEATGWYLDKDAKWKFALKTVPKPTHLLSKLAAGQEYMLKDLVSYKELFDSYPGLGNLKVVALKFKGLTGKGVDGAKGSYDPRTHTIELAIPTKYALDRAVGKDPDTDGILNTLGHEVQHAIQEIENFAKGGSLDSVKSHPKHKYLEKISELYQAVIKKVRPEISGLFEIAVNGEKEEKEAATKEIRAKITAQATMLMKTLYKYDDEQVAKAIAHAKKYQLHSATPEQITFIVYSHLLGEVEARAAGAMWVGETYDTSSYENIVERWGNNISASTIQALYNKETKQVILNDDVLESGKVEGVVYHEVGVHMYADVIRSNEFLQDKAVKLLDRGLKSGNTKVREFFVGVSKRLEEAGEVNNKEETLAYLVEEGFNTLENHELFDPKDRLDQALNKMRKIIPAIVVDLITEVIKAFVGKMKNLTRRDVNKVKAVARGGLTGLTYDLELQADYNQIVNLVRKGTKEVADKYKAVPKKVEEESTGLPSWATPELMARLRGDNTVATVYNNLTENCK